MRSEAEEARPGGVRAALDLAALVRDCVAADVVRQVLHLRLAGLGPGAAPRHQRLLREALEPVMAAARTRVFELPNGDVVAVAPPPALALDHARQALLGTLDAGAAAAVQAFRLPDCAAHLLAVTAESLGLAEIPPPPPAGIAGPPIGSYDLAMAERALAQADLGAMTTAQAVCRLDPEGEPAEAQWEDRRIAWGSLAEAVLPGIDIGASSALQRRLARLAETRLLADIGRPAAQLDWRPVGLPVVPATLATPTFQRFDAGLPAGRRREITLGFRPADILADPAGFAQARDSARMLGYRLALDDAAVAVAAVLRPDRLGLDLLRLRWSADLPLAGAALQPWLAQPDAVVLVGVDRPAAIAWGWEAGISLFQGPLVERRRSH
ncbi:hypothetical protein [Falsiroseomonas selenitidurans]|uniref:EAL domain-containing protein n=1 Tax=Falsiroseomonas selenitidurans TaxID=2716335 RepID=A0ABX1E8N7_9PROT|nr:hypothetical protein [Falsiroseomonas selenitidurans]NKC31867.1 hypothetical protein [Falsiroseomonas selenitidurans]